MLRSSVVRLPVRKVDSAGAREEEDMLAAEEPLEIRLDYCEAGSRVQKSISVTMRTPGHDFELAAGFLFTEGIIKSASDITSIRHCNGLAGNVVRVTLAPEVTLDTGRLDRHFYTSSSCGVCGKSSIEAVRTVCPVPAPGDNLQVSARLLYALPHLLRQRQDVFAQTGGLHASALFDMEGNFLMLREDVGRHNALDKVAGACLQEGLLPLHHHILLLSGRASFELVQKASMAGIRIVAAVGAPSSLAVELAEEGNMTLIGFLREHRFNIYCGVQRVTTNTAMPDTIKHHDPS